MEFSALFFHDAFTFLEWDASAKNDSFDATSSGGGRMERKTASQADVHPTLRLLTIGTAADHLGHLLDLHLATLAAASFPIATLTPTHTLLSLFEKRSLGADAFTDGYADSSPYVWLHRWVAVYMHFVVTTLNVVVGARTAGLKTSVTPTMSRNRWRMKRKPGLAQQTSPAGKAKRHTRGHHRRLSSSGSDESQDLADDTSSSESSDFSSKKVSTTKVDPTRMSDNLGGSSTDMSNTESDGGENGSCNASVESDDDEEEEDDEEDDDDDDDDDIVPADNSKRLNVRASNRFQARRRQAHIQSPGAPGADSVAVRCLQHVVRTIGAVLPVLRVRIEDCIVWRATCRNPQARNALLARNLTPRVLQAEPEYVLDVKRLADLLAQCDHLRACLHGLCRQVKARVRINVTVSVMRKIPLANAAVEAFAATLRAIAQENHLDVQWFSDSTYEVPIAPGVKQSARTTASQPAQTIGSWLARVFELPANDVSVDFRWNQKQDHANARQIRSSMNSSSDGSGSESEEDSSCFESD